jgi:hypothetical protein
MLVLLGRQARGWMVCRQGGAEDHYSDFSCVAANVRRRVSAAAEGRRRDLARIQRDEITVAGEWDWEKKNHHSQGNKYRFMWHVDFGGEKGAEGNKLAVQGEQCSLDRAHCTLLLRMGAAIHRPGMAGVDVPIRCLGIPHGMVPRLTGSF